MIPRIPKNYDGKEPTGRSIESLLPAMMDEIKKKTQGESLADMIAAWNAIVGEKIARDTHVKEFRNGALIIGVKNATLLSILSSQEKGRLLQNLKKNLPHVHFKNLVFQFG